MKIQAKEDIVATYRNTGIYYAGSVSGAGLLIFGIALAGSVRGRKKISNFKFQISNKKRLWLLIAVIIVTAMFLVSCGDPDNNGNDDNGVSYTVSGLNTGTTYHWKVAAKDGNGEEAESDVWRFTTQ